MCHCCCNRCAQAAIQRGDGASFMLHLSQITVCSYSVFAEVTFLMRDGLRLKNIERAPPKRFTVTILESDRSHNNSGRNIVEASLYVSYGSAQMAGRGRIMDPVILPTRAKAS